MSKLDEIKKETKEVKKATKWNELSFYNDRIHWENEKSMLVNLGYDKECGESYSIFLPKKMINRFIKDDLYDAKDNGLQSISIKGRVYKTNKTYMSFPDDFKFRVLVSKLEDGKFVRNDEPIEVDFNQLLKLMY